MKLLVRRTTLTASAVMLALVVSMFFGRWFWPFEIATNFRPYWLGLAVMLSIAVGFSGRRRDLLFSLVPVVLLAVPLTPFYLGGPTPLTQDTESIGVLQYNIWYRNTDYDAIVGEILNADADIVSLNEVTHAAWTVLEPKLAHAYPYFLPSPAWDGGPWIGEVMLSRSSLELAPVETDYPTDPLAARTSLNGHEILAISMHLDPTHTNAASVNHRHQEALSIVDAVNQHDLPAIIITDLNAAATSPEYGRFLRELGWDNPRRGIGLYPTFPTWGGPIGMTLDHVFVSPEFSVHSYELGDGGGSDHRSLKATISLQPVRSSNG